MKGGDEDLTEDVRIDQHNNNNNQMKARGTGYRDSPVKTLW